MTEINPQKRSRQRFNDDILPAPEETRPHLIPSLNDYNCFGSSHSVPLLHRCAWAPVVCTFWYYSHSSLTLSPLGISSAPSRTAWLSSSRHATTEVHDAHWASRFDQLVLALKLERALSIQSVGGIRKRRSASTTVAWMRAQAFGLFGSFSRQRVNGPVYQFFRKPGVVAHTGFPDGISLCFGGHTQNFIL